MIESVNDEGSFLFSLSDSLCKNHLIKRNAICFQQEIHTSFSVRPLGEIYICIHADNSSQSKLGECMHWEMKIKEHQMCPFGFHQQRPPYFICRTFFHLAIWPSFVMSFNDVDNWQDFLSAEIEYMKCLRCSVHSLILFELNLQPQKKQNFPCLKNLEFCLK